MNHFVGVDWAGSEHAICVVDEKGGRRADDAPSRRTPSRKAARRDREHTPAYVQAFD